jgi:hypothetical protein
MKSKLRGIFLTSEHPAKTATFYREVVGLALTEIGGGSEYVYWKIDEEGIQLAIHDANAFAEYTHPVHRESNLTHLYFKIESQAEFLQHLDGLNVSPYARDEVVVTVVDPDGRKVMFGTA